MCCYCGGTRSTASIDHVPPTAYFVNKQRPNEWEVPACKTCHDSFAVHDAFFALMSRLNLSAFDGERATDRALKNIISSSNHKYSEVLTIWATQSKKKWRLVNGVMQPFIFVPLDHWLIHDCINFTLARFSAALFYAFSGKALPLGSRIVTGWQSNDDRMQGKVADEVIAKLGEYKFPKMGKAGYSDQFECRYLIEKDEIEAAFAFNLHRAWVGYGFVTKGIPEKLRDDMYLFGVSRDGLAKEKGAR